LRRGGVVADRATGAARGAVGGEARADRARAALRAGEAAARVFEDLAGRAAVFDLVFVPAVGEAGDADLLVRSVGRDRYIGVSAGAARRPIAEGDGSRAGGLGG